MSSTGSTGDHPLGPDRPYVLAVASHKGGTGRTTLAVAVAWLWADRGLKVALVDADPGRAASLVAAGRDGRCPWPNATLVAADGGAARIPPGRDAVVVDAPPLTEPLARQVLRRADGVLVCTLADPLALSTLPSATRAVRAAREGNPGLALVGVAVNLFAPADPSQAACLAQLRSARAELLVGPPVPVRPELRAWPLAPGSPLPDGPAKPALRAVADAVRERAVAAGWGRLSGRGAVHAHAAGG